MSWRVVSAASIGALAALQPLAEQVFGAAARHPTWFRRKLVRECIDPALSQVAIRDDAPPGDPRGWIGYILVGRPPSGLPGARAAGAGVLAPWRRRGVGTALLDAAATDAAAHGARILELSAQRELESFYVDRAFAVQQRVTTLLSFARGPGLGATAAGLDADDGRIELHGFLPEAWSRSPPDERSVVRTTVPGVVHWLCREAQAIAVHRTTIARAAAGTDAACRSFAALLEAMPSPTPVLALAMPEVSSITASLRDAGWTDIQRSTVVHRRLCAHPPGSAGQPAVGRR